MGNMLANDLIEESESPWCSPTIIVMKKSTDPLKPQFRFCVDFRMINKHTVKDSFPLPRIDETIEALAVGTVGTGKSLYQSKTERKQRSERTVNCTNTR